MKPIGAFATAGLFLMSHHAAAVGFRLPNQDPEAIARGNAFVATADNPSAIYHNPAGITQLEGQQLSLGAYLISTNVDFESPAGTAETDEGIQAVPQFHYVHSLANSSYSWGVGVYVPYGLGIDYGRDTPFSTIAQEAELKYISINPVLAYEVSDALSLALGLTLNYSEVDLRQAVGLLPGDEFRLNGDGWDYGFNLGGLLRLNEKWSIGASFRSETEIGYEGESQVNPLFPARVPTRAELKFPKNFDVGVAYRPSDLWTFEINLDWTDWSAVESTVFEGTSLGDLPLAFNYKDSTMYEFGVSRVLSNGLIISGGYIFSENSAPDENFTPLNPDSNLQLFSVGLSNRQNDIGWALGYHLAYNGGRTVSGNQSSSPILETADGRYETFNQAVNISLTYSF